MFPNIAFPLLVVYRITSKATETYNCIAWAAEDDTQPWWPSQDAFWPPGVPINTTVAAFIQAFGTLGYFPCSDGSLENGYIKVVLYALGADVKHAARQLPSGLWASKLGKAEDIEHDTPESLTGPVYGQVVQFLCRPTI